jgi:threonine/homoserine/homoserine lactone efflux protein
MNTSIPLLLFCLSTMLTPGPNNFMLMNSGLNFGLQRSLPHYLGICLGFPLMVLIVSLGFGEIFQKYLWLKHALKIIGSVYMLYLAGQILFSVAKSKAKSNAKPFSFFQAVMFQWINPKAWLMAIGAVSIFSLVDNYIQNAIIISVVFLIIGLPSIGSWLLFGASLRKILKNEKHQRWFNIAMAVCLIASIATVIF